MTSSVVYNSDLRTTCTHLNSGNSIETDAPRDNHGKGERFSPTDLLATSLSSCMLTVMGIKASGMGLKLDGIETTVNKIMKADPRRVGGIEINFSFPPALQNLSEKEREILKNTAETCPVLKSLHPDIEIVVDWSSWG